MSTDVIDYHHDADGTDVFGFWLYILTDIILFGCLFATYFVLHRPGAFGPALKDFIDLKYVLVETFLLLGSNFTFGLSVVAFNASDKKFVMLWLSLTFLLGAGFVAMELNEFAHLIHEGYSYTTSGAASSFFTLVGTHGLHVSFGLLWILVMLAQIPIYGTGNVIKRRMIYLGLFWNFLDIVWIFLFSFIYLMGVL